MSKVYYLTFSPSDPRTFPGLSPTMLIFNNNGTAVTPPAIGAVAGANGVYSFTWGTTTPIFFLADAATTGPGSGRYVQGVIDPADRADEYGSSIVAQGVSILAQNVSIIAQGVTIYAFDQSLGSTLAGIGSTSIGLGNTILSLVSTGYSVIVSIGSTASSAGDSVTDPGTLFGYLKRVAELVQGQETFIKGTGVFSMYDRTGATLFNQRTISNSASMVTRT